MAPEANGGMEPFVLGEITAYPDRLYLESASGRSQLEPKVMQLLQVLASEPGKTFSRNALIDAVWGVRFGGDESLSRAVSLLRKALQTPHGGGDVIQTVPKRGYVLVADVRGAEQQSPADTTRAQDVPLIAVLPFDNLSSDPDTLFFSDGVTEDIIDRLIRGTDLKVIGRTSSFQFRGDRKFEAASELNAGYIVDGSVRRAGKRVRISAHLERADTRETLWSDRYDRELGDIFAVQDEISEQIARTLDRKMEAQRQTIMAPEIYDLFLQGQEWTQSAERLLDAVSALERVTTEAPDFASAWGALARNRALVRMYSPSRMRNELDKGVQAAINRAIELDPRNRDALSARYQRLDHFGPALEHHDTVSALRDASFNSAGGLFLVAFHEESIGCLRNALRVANEAARLDPLNPVSANLPGAIHLVLGNLSEGRASLEPLVRKWPQEPTSRAALITLVALQGDAETLAQMTAPEVIHKYPMAEYEPYVEKAQILCRNNKDEMRKAAKTLQNKLIKRGVADTNDLLTIGMFADADMFFDTMDQVRIGLKGDEHDAVGPMAYRSVLWFHHLLKHVRANPRFITACARLGLVKFWLETGIRPDFADEVDYDFEAACRDNADIPADVYNLL